MKNSLPILPNLIRKKGFTLIELLIVSVILVIIMGSIAIIFFQATKSWTTTEAKLQIYQNARESLNRMSREIACVFQPSDANKQLQLTSDTYDSYDKDELIFTATLNVAPGSGEYDLTHLGYRLKTDVTPPQLQRYKRDYDGTYDGSQAKLDIYWKEMAVNIISLSIEAHDGAAWQPTWSSSNLPKAIRVTIKVQDKQARFDPKEFKIEIYLPASQ